MNEYAPDPSQDLTPGSEGEENLPAELWRLWINELKPRFEAEKDFLVKYGAQTGYGPDYVERVLRDQKLLEELIGEREERSIHQFARILGDHIRFKNDFFTSRVCDILDLEGPASGGGKTN